MKIQQFRGKSFVHRDMTKGMILQDPWIKRGLDSNRIEIVKGPKRKFKLRNKEYERDVCWITNNSFVAQSIKEGKSEKVLPDIKRGMVRKCLHDRMIKDENDKYICYAVDDEDWRQEGDEAWDDVTGKKLDPAKGQRSQEGRDTGIPRS